MKPPLEATGAWLAVLRDRDRGLKVTVRTLGLMKNEMRLKTESGVVLHVFFILGRLRLEILSWRLA